MATGSAPATRTVVTTLCAAAAFFIPMSGCKVIPSGVPADTDARPGRCDTAIDVTLLPVGSLSIGTCRPLQAGEFDYERAMIRDTCSVGETLVRSRRRSTGVDSDLVISTPETTRTIDDVPASGFSPKGIGGASALACDSEARRFYFGNPYVGSLSSFTAKGIELWRQDIPGFVRIPGHSDVDGNEALELVKAAQAWGSVVGPAAVSGSLVAVQFSTGTAGGYRNWHWIVHRSGQSIGTIGPWDGLLLGPTDSGFQFATGGLAANGRVPEPTTAVVINVLDHRADQVIEHFLAWCLPDTPNSPWRWRQCALLSPQTIRWRLGSEYDEKMAEMTKQVHDRLGLTWAGDLLSRGGITRIGMMDPRTPDRDALLRRELIAVGADVDFVKTAREMKLLSKP